jgi:G3E family GTPase
MAIVVNEFGDVGIDGDLLPKGMSHQVELPGGCICCVLNEDLDKTLLGLLDSEPDLVSVVIETTGVAEPAPITWSLDREPLDQRVRLAAVVTVVDALQHETHRKLTHAVDLQVEYADLLVISKLDLVEGGQPPDSLVAELRDANAHAPLLVSPPDRMADLVWQSLNDPQLAERREASPGASHIEGSAHEAQGGVHRHGHDFDTVALTIEHTLDFEELASSLEELPANYVRIKGIACVIDESTGSTEPHFVAFHRVGARVSHEPVAPAPARMVALGPGIERARLAACLDAAVVI